MQHTNSPSSSAAYSNLVSYLKPWVLSLCGLMCCAQLALAQDFPSRPVKIFGHGAGSTADFLSRYIGQKLSEKWGQPVVIDNRAGAGGTIPGDMVAKSAADGYTLFMGHAGPMVSSVTLYPNLPYDPAAEVSGPCVLSVIEGGNHVVNNLWYRYRDQTADWMAVQLKA